MTNRDRFLAGEVFTTSDRSYYVRYLKENDTIVMVDNGHDIKELCEVKNIEKSVVEYEFEMNGMTSTALLIYSEMIFSVEEGKY